MRKNWYTDELLRLRKDTRTAKRLVHDAINICPEGGFCLTKFVSNKAEVLQQTSEEDRRSVLKSVSLNNGADLPVEKASAVKWNTKSDKLGYTVNSDAKVKTRQRTLLKLSKINDTFGLAASFLMKRKRTLQELCKSDYSWDDMGSERHNDD